MEAQLAWMTIVISIGLWGCWWELSKIRRLLQESDTDESGEVFD